MNWREWGSENVEVVGVDNPLEVCCKVQQRQWTRAGEERHVDENNLTASKAPGPQERGTLARAEEADGASVRVHRPRKVLTPHGSAAPSIFIVLGTWAPCPNVFIYSFVLRIFPECPLHAWFVLGTPQYTAQTGPVISALQ